jgi:hypothetical protein
MSPFAASPSAWQQSINHHWQGGGAGIYSHPTSALHLQERADPLLWVDRPTLFFYFIFLTYLPTLELV